MQPAISKAAQTLPQDLEKAVCRLKAKMLGASFLPSRFRGPQNAPGTGKPGWINVQISAVIQSLSRRACTHPIHTVVFVALLASTTYIGLLEGSLFDRTGCLDDGTQTNFTSLVEGSRTLRSSHETGWKWHVEDNGRTPASDKVCCTSTHGDIVKAIMDMLTDRNRMHDIWLC